MRSSLIRTTKKILPEKYAAVLYADGACKGNPGVGGWGCVALHQRKHGEAELFASFGGDQLTTNNRMELRAVIEGLAELSTYSKAVNCLIVVDSEYVLKGATEWAAGWVRRNWIKADKKPVANADLWQELISAMDDFEALTWCWVRGHTGNAGNERADQLANQGVDRVRAEAGA